MTKQLPIATGASTDTDFSGDRPDKISTDKPTRAQIAALGGTAVNNTVATEIAMAPASGSWQPDTTASPLLTEKGKMLARLDAVEQKLKERVSFWNKLEQRLVALERLLDDH